MSDPAGSWNVGELPGIDTGWVGNIAERLWMYRMTQ